MKHLILTLALLSFPALARDVIENDCYTVYEDVVMMDWLGGDAL